MKPVQRLYNIIKLPLTIILIMALGFFAFQGFVVQAVALEQDVRCGIEEHLHGTSCYQDNRLVCSLEEHTHTGNCYLVLLQDNDINDLLTQMDEQEDKSLEGLIGQTAQGPEDTSCPVCCWQRHRQESPSFPNERKEADLPLKAFFNVTR